MVLKIPPEYKVSIYSGDETWHTGLALTNTPHFTSMLMQIEFKPMSSSYGINDWPDRQLTFQTSDCTWARCFDTTYCVYHVHKFPYLTKHPSTNDKMVTHLTWLSLTLQIQSQFYRFRVIQTAWPLLNCDILFKALIFYLF